MPANWEARDKKLKKRRLFMADNRGSIRLEVEMRDKRDQRLAERARKREQKRRTRGYDD